MESNENRMDIRRYAEQMSDAEFAAVHLLEVIGHLMNAKEEYTQEGEVPE